MDKKILLSKKPMILIGIVVSIIIIIGGYIYYISEKESFREEKHNELSAISNLKINQILKWREERIADVKVTTQSEFFESAVAQWFMKRDNLILKKEIEDRLKITKTEYSFENICIADTKGELQSSVEDMNDGIDSVMKQEVIKTAEKKKLIFSDFYECQFDGKVNLTISSPLKKDNEVFAVLVFIIDPNEYIFPIIQSWPTPSETAETILLKKDGDSVLFINELRYKKKTAMEYKIPLTDVELPAVKAVLGYTGIYEGKDYRGVDVLTDINRIPDTDWYMIAKVDQKEIYSKLRYRTGIIIGFISLFIFLLSIGLAYIYNYRQSDIYQELYLKEKELLETQGEFRSTQELYLKEKELREIQEEFRTTLYSIGDGVITTDTYGNVRYMNHVAEELTGWREFDATGKPLTEVFKILNEDTGEKVENPVDKILKEGIVIGLANHTLLIHKKGKQIPIADSGAPIKDENKNLKGIVLVFRDQTEEREHQKQLRESEEFSRRIIESSSDCIKVLDLEGNLLSMSLSGQKLMEIDDITPYLNKSWIDYWKDNDRDACLKAISKAKKDNAGTFMGFCETAKGTPKWWEVIITPIKDSQGNIDRLLSISRDISERKQAEEENHRKSAILSAINNVFKKAITCETVEEVSYTCICMAEELTRSRAGFIGEVNKEGLFDTLSYGDLRWQICKMPKTDAIALSKNMVIRGIFGQAMLKGKSQIVNDPDSHPDRVGIPEGHPQLKCFMGVPLKHEGKVIGMIGLANKEGGYTSADQKTVESLSLTFVEALNRKRAEEVIVKSREQLRNLSSHLQTIREDERGVISREIHDDLGQSLTALKMDISWFKKHLPEDVDSKEQKINGMIELVNATIKSVQRISTELRPAVLDDLGFSSAVKWFINEFEERSGLKCKLEIKPDNIVLDEKLSIAMYRIFQESLTNIMRHANATKVNVNIALKNHKLEMSVADNGIGIDESKLKDLKSLGLIGMQERLYTWNGEMEIKRLDGKGTVIRVNVKC